MEKYLPSKKFVVLIVSILVVLVIIFIILNLIGKKETFRKGPQGGTSLEQLVTLEGITDKDSDGDGIPDWEEALWGTDPNKKDTDGDGISDYEEITLRKAALQIELPESERELTETEKFSREFFATVVALKQSGNLSPEAIENLASSFSQSITGGEITDAFGRKDILISDDSSESRENYLNQLFELLSQYTEKNLGGELEIVAIALQTGNEEIMQELGPISKGYRDFALEAQRFAVPESQVNLHLQMINSTAKLSLIIGSLGSIINDPLVGMNAFALYQKYSEEFIDAVEELTTL